MTETSMNIKNIPAPFDFNRFKISPDELQELMESPQFKKAINAKLIELQTLYSHHLKHKGDLQLPATYFQLPETAFILSAKVLELKATFLKQTK